MSNLVIGPGSDGSAAGFGSWLGPQMVPAEERRPVEGHSSSGLEVKGGAGTFHCHQVLHNKVILSERGCLQENTEPQSSPS